MTPRLVTLLLFALALPGCEQGRPVEPAAATSAATTPAASAEARNRPPDGVKSARATPAVRLTAYAPPVRPRGLPWPAGTRTPNEAVNEVLDAVEAGDVARLVALVEYSHGPCTTSGHDVAPAVCEEGEVDGQTVPHISWASCSGTMRPRSVPAAVTRFVERRRELLAVYTQTLRGGLWYADVEVVTILFTGGQPDQSTRIHLRGGHIHALALSECGGGSPDRAIASATSEMLPFCPN